MQKISLLAAAALLAIAPAAAMPPPLPDVEGRDAASLQAEMEIGRLYEGLVGDAYDGPSVSQMPAVAGYPHLTVPMGAVEGLPVGLSFIGAKWSDAGVLAAGYAYEQASRKRIAPTFRVDMTP